MTGAETRARLARRDEWHARLICGVFMAFLLALLVGAVGGAG